MVTTRKVNYHSDTFYNDLSRYFAVYICSELRIKIYYDKTANLASANFLRSQGQTGNRLPTEGLYGLVTNHSFVKYIILLLKRT